MNEQISIIPHKCTNCRSCEIACSYHFKKVYQPNTSKISILFDIKSDDMKISINDACNHCEDEKEPLCIKYCATGALILKQGG